MIKRFWKSVKRLFGQIWLGITIAESNRHRSGMGKL
jgi:hypothetical protein